jgi:hypothetical protein
LVRQYWALGDGVSYMRIVHRVREVRFFAFVPEMEELVRRGFRLGNLNTRGNPSKSEEPLGASPPSLQILVLHLHVYVTRAAADLPLFHGVSRKKLLAWPWPGATQMQSGGGIIGTDNQQGAVEQSMARTGANWRSPVLTGLRSTGLIWRGSGNKVAWIGRPVQRAAVGRYCGMA